MRWCVVTAALLLGGCGVPDEGPWMRPGQDCLSCHSSSGTASEKAWTVGGTVFDASGTPTEGAQIIIRDAAGRTLTLTSNGGGNFYTGETLQEPFQAVSVLYQGRQRDMPITSGAPARGACNTCHASNGTAGSSILLP